MDRQRENVSALWRAHLELSFPDELLGEQISGVDVVMVDEAVAGGVATWLGSSTGLDVERLRILREAEEQFVLVLDAMEPGPRHAYFASLQALAHAVSSAH
jgi:hypothetical protein